MDIEIRSDDSVHISGYANIPERESKAVITPRGKVNEVIEQRAFQRAIDKADNIDVLLDHNTNRKLASTANNTADIYEDNVGLYVSMETRDSEVVDAAKTGKLKGWSFNMMQVKDEVEQRADKLPLRRVKDFLMSEVSLILNKNPAYSSTSIEVRADVEEEVEIRSANDINIKTTVIEPKVKKETIDYSEYDNKINQLKVGK